MTIRFRPPAWRKLALALVVLAFSLAASEGGLRLWLSIRGEPYSAERTLQMLDVAVVGARAYVPPGTNLPSATDYPRYLLHPYTASEAWHDTGGVLKYFRNRPRPGDYAVVVTGGSVATDLAVSLRLKLPEILRDDPALKDRRITVLNYAHAAYKQPQQLIRLVYLLSFGYRPDAVIEIDGFNEVALATENGGSGANPLYPTASAWSAHASRFGPALLDDAPALARLVDLRERMKELVADARRRRLCESAWLGRMCSSRMAKLVKEIRSLQEDLLARSRDRQGEWMHRQLDGPDFDPDPEAVMASAVGCWAESSASMHALCAARGIRYVHVLQPALYDSGSKPMSSEEAAFPLVSEYWRTGPSVGYPLLRARIDGLRKQGVRFLDQSQVFADVTETVYHDACHLVARGQELWIERMSQDLRDALLGP